MDTGTAVCGEVYTDIDLDHYCLQDEGHDPPHECATESCRRQWVGHQPVGRTA